VAVKKILVIRVGRTGDIVMITAALQAILKKYPHAEIDVLTSPDGRRLLAGFDARLHIRFVHERKSLLEYFKRQGIIRQITAQHYDVVYCFELNPSFTQFYQRASAEVFQLQQTKQTVNYAHHCLELVRGPTDIQDKHEWIWLPLTEQGEQKTEALLAVQGINKDTVVIGFHPSFSGLRKGRWRSRAHRQEKAWPVEHFGELAVLLDQFAQEQGLKLAILMDLLPEDRELGEAIIKASGGLVKMMIPSLDFDRYKSTLARMHILVVPNTGPMHIAGAVGTNLVALFADLDPGDSGAYVPTEQCAFICPKLSVPTGLASITPVVVSRINHSSCGPAIRTNNFSCIPGLSILSDPPYHGVLTQTLSQLYARQWAAPDLWIVL